MSKNVLLARLHPFIVAEMKPFLEKNGDTLVQLDTTMSLPFMASKAGGAIISLDLLFFRKNDLTTPTRRALAARMVKRHFSQ